MLNYFFKRLLGLLPTLLIVAVLVFLFVHMLPGDPARLAAGQDADEATVQLVRQELGLDKPLPEQFVHFFSRMERRTSSASCWKSASSRPCTAIAGPTVWG